MAENKYFEDENKYFEKEYTVRYSEITPKAEASLSSVMAYFQDTSMFHSDSVGQGIGNLMQRHTAWLLASWHIKIDRYPRYAEKIRVRTWATKFASVYGYRDFEIVDEKGQRLACASSAWILYNSEEKKMKRVTQEIADTYKPQEKFVFEGEEARLRVPKEYTDISKRTVCRRDIDTNSHMNNIYYVDFALEALPADFEIRELRVSYKKAAVLGDEVNIGITQEGENSCTCVLHDGNGSVYTVLKFN